MSLKSYRVKRKFNTTPEPKPKLRRGGSKTLPVFVVQKHDASRLHYDFRIEHKGVLKSWALPKGPSLNPSDKRLAVMTEDHPMEYKNFEGTIPEGSYGAGKVIVWDDGTFKAVDASSRKETEVLIHSGLKKGEFSFILNGKKLKGEFALVKLQRGKKDWLFFKKKDRHASLKDITKKNKSVISSREL